MVSVLDRYIVKHVIVATIFVGVVLSTLVLLTQSLRFLDLIIQSGASGFSFFALTLMALPRFFEIVIPIGLMTGVLFVYNRLLIDSELIAMKGLGFSPLALARPALILSLGLSVFLFVVMAWVVPYSNAHMQEKRLMLRNEISTFLFREGVFNQAGKGLMVYVRSRDADGNLHGLIVHDERDPTKTPATIIASKGIVVSTDTGQQVIVYSGSRQEYDEKKSLLRRLNFDQYTIDLPNDEAEPMAMRWREPDERSFFELFTPNTNDLKDRKELNEFMREIHKRITTPFLVISYAAIGLYFLLIGSLDRRGAGRRILSAVACMVAVQVAYMVSYSIAKKLPTLIPFMYLVAITPGMVAISLLWQPNPSKPIPHDARNQEVSS